MWKRDEAVRPASAQPTPPLPAVQNHHHGTTSPSTPTLEVRPMMGREVVNIGKSVVIKGELSGNEDLTVEGLVEGKIELKDHVLTVGPNGKIRAHVSAKALIVLGEVNGNVTASERVEIRDGGSLDGDIVSPRVAIADGAHFRGTVDMQRRAMPPATAVQPRATGVAPGHGPTVPPAQPTVR